MISFSKFLEIAVPSGGQLQFFQIGNFDFKAEYGGVREGDVRRSLYDENRVVFSVKIRGQWEYYATRSESATVQNIIRWFKEDEAHNPLWRQEPPAGI